MFCRGGESGTPTPGLRRVIKERGTERGTALWQRGAALPVWLTAALKGSVQQENIQHQSEAYSTYGDAD